MRGGCGPPCSFRLNQALRYARSETAKGRGVAASCATRDAPRWSDARRLWAAVQLWADQALRHARCGTAKARGAAASWATRDALKWSDTRRLWAAVQL